MARLVPVSRLRAVLGVEEFPERLDPRDDHQQVVAAECEHGIDQIVPRALIAQMHLEPVGKERGDCLPFGRHRKWFAQSLTASRRAPYPQGLKFWRRL